MASAATNLTYAVSRSDALSQQIIWGAVAVAASVALALAPSAIVACLSARRYGAATLALTAGLIFGAYSVTAALGSATGGRLVAETEATDTADKRRSATDRIESAARELSSLKPSRPVSELDAEIAMQMASRKDLSDCVGWLPNVNARAVCVTVSELKAERGRAERRAELEATMAAARDVLAGLKASKTIANADAIALQGYAKALGLTLDADTLNRLLVVLAVLVIEFGGGLAFAVGQGLGMQRETAATAALVPEEPRVPTGNGSEMPLDTAPAPPLPSIVVPAGPSRDASPGAAVLEVLRNRGGAVVASQRSMADLFGLSRSTVNRTLHELAMAGTVKVVATSRGTAVSLAAAH